MLREIIYALCAGICIILDARLQWLLSFCSIIYCCRSAFLESISCSVSDGWSFSWGARTGQWAKGIRTRSDPRQRQQAESAYAKAAGGAGRAWCLGRFRSLHTASGPCANRADPCVLRLVRALVSHGRSTHVPNCARRTSPAAEDANGERYGFPVHCNDPHGPRRLCVLGCRRSFIVFEGA
jgi:hypothetical protein